MLFSVIFGSAKKSDSILFLNSAELPEKYCFIKLVQELESYISGCEIKGTLPISELFALEWLLLILALQLSLVLRAWMDSLFKKISNSLDISERLLFSNNCSSILFKILSSLVPEEFKESSPATFILLPLSSIM